MMRYIKLFRLIIRLKILTERSENMNWSKVLSSLMSFTIAGSSTAAAASSDSTETQIAAAIAAVLSMVAGIINTVKSSK